MPETRKKTWLVDQRLVRRVCRIYRAKTETEAVTRALQEAVFREKVRPTFRAAAGKIPDLERVYGGRR